MPLIILSVLGLVGIAAISLVSGKTVTAKATEVPAPTQGTPVASPVKSETGVSDTPLTDASDAIAASAKKHKKKHNK